MTKTATLRCKPVGDGVSFAVTNSEGQLLPPEVWGLHDVIVAGGQRGSVAPLVGLVEDESIAVGSDNTAFVPNSIIAAWNEPQVHQLGLPPVAPVRLKIQGRGILTAPAFRFNHQFVKADQTPVMGLRRDGVFVEMMGKTYILLDPLYSLVEGMNAFNETPPSDMDDRMLQWADLKRLLPEDAVVDNSLRSMNIVRADSFTLDLDDRGDFSPQLLQRPQASTKEDGWEEPGQSTPILPPAPQRDFEQRFRKQAQARRHYTTAGNWFVVVPRHLHQALEIIREKQEAPYSEKRAFLANPMAALKERLQDSLGDEFQEDDIERLFEETPEFLSNRISHLGKWEPKQNVYILPFGQKWLPDDVEGFGVLIGGNMFNLVAADVSEIVQRLVEAKEQGKPSIEYRDQVIPVNDEALEVIGRLEEKPKTFTKPAVLEEGEVEKPPGQPLVPVLLDNVEELGFKAEKRPIRGEPSGVPAALKTTSLYDHQQDGVKWLQEHWAAGSTGALLADDMGLGKTLQTLTFLAWIQEQMAAANSLRRPLLIVAPTGLLKNWEDEAQMHLTQPGLGRLFKAFGTDLGVLKNLSHNQRKETLERADWILTTFETLRDKIRYFLPVRWGVVVFDEVQKIKNPASRLTEMAKSVEAEFFLALTGTPVENRLGDLWSIIDTVAPGSLGSLHDFHKRYEDVDEATKSAVIPELREALMVKPEPVRLLRRMKADHLKGLPDKTEHLIEAPMPVDQARAYDRVIAPARAGGVSQTAILGILQGMRKVSLLAGELREEGLTDEQIASSARLSALVKILDEIHNKREKALVFVEFLAIQDALIPYLQHRYQMPKPPLRISGAVAGKTRKKHVDEFQKRPRDEFDVMLLSPKAGGVGLTLTAANNVIHLSRWWNPAVEDQCTDRVFRIGQERAVNVYIPLAIHPALGESSFDVNLHQLLERKRALSAQLLSGPMAEKADLEDLLMASLSK